MISTDKVPVLEKRSAWLHLGGSHTRDSVEPRESASPLNMYSARHSANLWKLRKMEEGAGACAGKEQTRPVCRAPALCA